MLFRCSVCKGKFEVEPERQKPVIFCSHCGAALRTGKTGRPTGSVADTAATQALTGGAALDQLASTQAGPSEGYVEEYQDGGGFSANALHAPAAARNPAGDALSALAGPSAAGAAPAASSPPAYRRPPRKKDNTAAIMIISIIGIVVVFAVIIIALFVFSGGEEPKKVKREDDGGGGGPGMFGGVKDGTSAYPDTGARHPPPAPRNTPSARPKQEEPASALPD